MKKTKIVCTMGPNIDGKKDILRGLIENGMNVARLNFSHGDHEEQYSRVKAIREVSREMGNHIAILLDTKGPEIRTKFLENHTPVELIEGSTFVLTADDVIGNSSRVSITEPVLLEDLSVGDKVLIDDGLIELEVTQIEGNDIVCKVLNGGTLSEKKGVNVPNVDIHLPAVTQKDKEDLLFAIKHDLDFIAASFIRNAEGIIEIKEFMKENGGDHIPIIAKIENASGINNIDAIIEVADGIMVARGDLGVEIPESDVPFVQKMIIKKCNQALKPVITATQMLDSMIRNPRPTRAEVTDVANAIYDGTDAIMLSGETAMGKYPIEAVRTMSKIAESTEARMDYQQMLLAKSDMKTDNISTCVGYAAVSTATNLHARCILIPTVSGNTARIISVLRPKMPCYALSPNPTSLRKMQLFWGVTPMKSYMEDSTEEIILGAVDIARANGNVSAGDVVVITAGFPVKRLGFNQTSTSNMMEVLTVS